MDIEKLIEELEDILDNASNVPFSRKVAVEPDEMLEVISEMRKSLPEEIKQARWVNQEKDKIIKEAENEANLKIQHANDEIQKIKQQAQSKYKQLINEHNITLEAKREANAILQKAHQDAADLKLKSTEYINKLFLASEDNFKQVVLTLEQNRKKILNK